MPNRILHESIKYCPKMEQLNWFEEVVYHRLTVSVDDYGCLDGRIVLLKNTLFPTREDISKDDIARAIEHMVALGLLRAYEAGGMPYLHFPAWEEEQRVRNKRRKFPAPPDEEEPPAAEDSLSAADGGALFAGEKHLTASCCQLTAGCPPESNPYPNPYPYPDSNPKFESGSVTNPYPIQAPGACAEERPRAGEQSLRHSLRCDTVPQFSMGASLRSQSSLEMLPASLGLLRPASATGGGLRAPLFAKREAIDGAIPEDGVRPLAEESPRPASALPSEGAQEAPREDGQSLRRGCAAPKGSPFPKGELAAKPTEGCLAHWPLKPKMREAKFIPAFWTEMAGFVNAQWERRNFFTLCAKSPAGTRRETGTFSPTRRRKPRSRPSGCFAPYLCGYQCWF